MGPLLGSDSALERVGVASSIHPSNRLKAKEKEGFNMRVKGLIGDLCYGAGLGIRRIVSQQSGIVGKKSSLRSIFEQQSRSIFFPNLVPCIVLNPRSLSQLESCSNLPIFVMNWTLR